MNIKTASLPRAVAKPAATAFQQCRLRGHGARWLQPQAVAFAYEVGVMELNGPEQDQAFQCTLGVECIIEVEGHGLGQGSALLLGRESCPLARGSLAQLGAAQLRVSSSGTISGDECFFYMKPVESDGSDDEAEVELLTGSGGVHAIIFSGHVLQNTARSYSAALDALTPYELAAAIHAQPPGTLVAVAVAGNTQDTFRDEKFLSALEYIGAKSPRAFVSGDSYALVGLAAGPALAESLEPSNATSLQVFVPSPLPQRQVNETGATSLGTLVQGGGAAYPLCWSWQGVGDLVHIGSLQVLGPGPDRQQWQCMAGEPCFLELTGSGLTLNSSLVIGRHGSLSCEMDSDEAENGLQLETFPEIAGTDGASAKYYIGTTTRRTAPHFSICWRVSPSAVPVVIGTLLISETSCALTSESQDRSLVHNCSDMKFLDTCTIQCAPGWSYFGPSASMTCRAKGELDGRLPQCTKVSCPLHSVETVEGCDCIQGYSGTVTWNSPSQTYLTSCQECAGCGVGQYRSECGGSTPGECRNCTNAGPGYYYVSDGGAQPHGCQTQPCVQCPTGRYPRGCGGNYPGRCQECVNMPNATPSTHYFSSSGTVDGICELQDCAPDCGVGQYRALCGGVNPGYCRACSPPAPGQYLASSGGLEDACLTQSCGGCEVGFFRDGCDMASLGTCAPCTNGPRYGYFYKSSSTVPNDCEYLQCGECPVGQYRANCGGASEGFCLPCTQIPHAYFVGSGGLVDACPSRPCAADEEECEVGMYRQGCGSLESPLAPGTCANCTEHKQSYFFVTNGGTSSRGCSEAPCQRCSAGWVRIGCGGASQGTCERCEHHPDYYFLADGGFGERNLTCPRSPCSDCPPGFYKHACATDPDHTSPGTCLECPAGRYQNEPYSDGCILAPTGTFATQGARMYTECPSGEYQDTEGSSECLQCRGETRRRRAATCEDCAVGRFNDGSQDSCQLCLGAVVMEGTQRIACHPCSVGKYNGGASDTCTDCKGGFVSSNTDSMTCTACPVEWYNDGSSNSCLQCPAGQTSGTNAESCISCGAGTKPVRGQCEPVPCPTGSTGTDVAGGCVCAVGFAGAVVASNLPPYFVDEGLCAPIEIRVVEETVEVWGSLEGSSQVVYRCGESSCTVAGAAPTSSTEISICTALRAKADSDQGLCR
ncbi:unnamed protein product [Symbiodinium natans]|uniref:Uncharacterized protein n=1 Tax=Symbiodinium natans TaxID=878477 RepID=A0A812JQC2_9DINO|nr:unnamed protein product [Symbiodinium natans]